MARSQTVWGAKLLNSSTAFRAFRNRHFGILMRCCQVWKPIGNCFDPISNERVEFQRLSQIMFRVGQACFCAQKPAHTAATLSGPTVSRGRSVSRKRSLRGKSNHGSILRQPCRCYLRGTGTSTYCECWHPPESQFQQNEIFLRLETSVCFRITRLNNQIKFPKELLPKK